MLTKLALKEWAVVVAALDRGGYTMLLRKGGIAERGFDIKGKNFVFYPTYFHEMEKHVESKYRDLLQDASANVKEETVTITNWAILDEVILTRDLDALLKLSDHHIYTSSYLEDRFDWRSENPMSVLIIRVQRLAEPVAIQVKSYYRGCKSWVDLEEAVDLENSAPVLDDGDFKSKKEEIKTNIYVSKLA